MLESIINSTKKFLVGSTLALSLYGCGEEPAVPESSGCTSNEQCRDDRVCSQGECVFPEDAVNNGVQEEALIVYGCYDPEADEDSIMTIQLDGKNGKNLGVAGKAFLYPQWSPDRQTIAYELTTAEGGSEIWTIGAKNGKQEKVNLPGSCYQPSWFHDSKQLIANCPYLDEKAGLYTFQFETGQSNLVLEANDGESRYEPRYVPGENFIVYRTGNANLERSIVSYDFVNTPTQRKALDRDLILYGYDTLKNKKLIYAVFSIEEGVSTLWHMDIETGSEESQYEQPEGGKILAVSAQSEVYLLEVLEKQEAVSSFILLKRSESSIMPIVLPCDGDTGHFDL